MGLTIGFTIERMKKLFNWLCIFIICNFSCNLSAFADLYPLMQEKSLAVKISKHGYTRFLIEDERITDVFVYPQESLKVKIHNQGYLIIVPDLDDKGFEKKDPVFLTITGENGTTQDISLRFTGKQPAPVKFTKLDWLIQNQNNKE